jgi:soluble lytic murein transglycosylase
MSKKARDKTIYNLVNYLYLIKPSNTATFNDYSIFINNKPYYPRIGRLRYLAEHKINLKTNTPLSILRWLNDQEPLSNFGKIKLGEIYIKQ